jgi:hypothetical protein
MEVFMRSKILLIVLLFSIIIIGCQSDKSSNPIAPEPIKSLRGSTLMQTQRVVTLLASPSSFPSQNGQMVPVTFTWDYVGQITYVLTDEYGTLSSTGTGSSSITINLEAACTVEDTNGRLYTFTISNTIGALATVNVICTAPPPPPPPVVIPDSIICSVKELWPPNGKMIPVKFSWPLTGSFYYKLTDEYGELTTGLILINNANAVTLKLEASRKGNDPNGRKYTFTLFDLTKTKSVSVNVFCPHDQRYGNDNNRDGDHRDDDRGDNDHRDDGRKGDGHRDNDHGNGDH